MNFGALGTVKVGVVDPVQSLESRKLVQTIEQVDTLKVSTGVEKKLRPQLEDGKLDVLIVLPVDFGDGQKSQLRMLYSEEREQQANVARSVLQQIFDQMTFQHSGVVPLYTLQPEIVSAYNLDFVDFLVPGGIGFSIMQLSVFGVAFAFVDLKKRGVLRRLLVTPINPLSFIFSEMVSRLIMISIQITLLFALGIVAFGLTVVGSKLVILLLSILGAVTFLMFGFTIAGYAEDQDQVPPIANIFTLPMMLLSGVFFPSEGLPQLLQSIAHYLPLTYLVDALREVANHGAGVGAITPDLLGLSIWEVAGLVLAVKFFKWE